MLQYFFFVNDDARAIFFFFFKLHFQKGALRQNGQNAYESKRCRKVFLEILLIHSKVKKKVNHGSPLLPCPFSY